MGLPKFGLMRPLPRRIVPVEVEALMVVNWSQRYRSLWAIVPLLLGLSCSVAAEPTLARLSFWLPPENRDAFAAAYEKVLLPLLQEHALRPFPRQSRASSDSVFSRLFAVQAPKQVRIIALKLDADPRWQQALRRVAAPDTTLRHHLRIYSTPAGSGRTTQVGSGTRQGLWQLFSVRDGLPSGWIDALLQDRRGDLWIGTHGGGVARYDGERFVTYTTEDGLVDDIVLSMIEDEEGQLWIYTPQGLSRYDGERFMTYTTEDGLGDFRSFSSVKLLKDRDGAIWVGTGEELSRYDGETFKQPFKEDGWTNKEVTALFQDRRGDLWIGTFGWGVVRYDGKTLTTFTTADGLCDNKVTAIAEDAAGHLWIGTGEGLSRYDGKTFETFRFFTGNSLSAYIFSLAVDREGNLWSGDVDGLIRYDGQEAIAFTARDGLGSTGVKAILEDRDGLLWIGTQSGGLLRYDGRLFQHFTTEEGLPTNYVFAVYQDRRGHLWFGGAGGVTRYDGQQLEVFTSEDGLANDRVVAIRQDRRGDLWFGMNPFIEAKGLSRYDGQHFETFTTADGLATNAVLAIYEDRRGRLWFGGSGVTVYDGQRFAPFEIAGVAPDEWTKAFLEDRQGNLWFAGDWGAARYDGQDFVRYSAADGLPDGSLGSIFEDRQGQLYVSGQGGLSRYDGETFTAIVTPFGASLVEEIIEDRRGHLWVGFFGSGALRYDGRVFQSLSRRDGLLDDGVHDLIEDRDGHVWIAGDGGVTRYTPYQRPPGIRLTEIVADRTYPPDADIAVTTGQDFVRFAFQGRSFLTQPEQMAYVYRLRGYEADWRSSRRNQVEYRDLPAGEYVFEVKAVDRDLNYSPEPATVPLRVHPPYLQLALLGGLGLALLGLVLASTHAVRRRRQFLREQQARLQAQEALNRELEEELQTAHDLQMSLMPTEPPSLEGFDLSGRCQPAAQVGGDFFQFFPGPEGRLTLVLADVTGHAMEAAIQVVLFDGLLESLMEQEVPLGERVKQLNRLLRRLLKRRTLVCTAMGEVDPKERLLQLVNAGCPYPYHYRAAEGKVGEVALNAYPLGAALEEAYPLMEVELAPGDRVVFCSDGLIEACKDTGELFGFERTAEVIQQGCAAGLSAQALVERLFERVAAFAGTTAPADDQTVVVLAVL